MNRSSEYELKYVIDVEIVNKTPRMSDKKLALICLGIYFILVIGVIWVGVFFVKFLYNTSKLLPYFFDKGIEIIQGGFL